MTHPDDGTADANLELNLPIPTRPTKPPIAILERNVEQWPLVNLSRSKIVKEHRFIEPNGDVVTVASASERGLPGPLGQDLYMALGYLLNKAMGGNATKHPPDRTVKATFAELVVLCCLDRGGAQYASIRDALDDLFAVHITGTHVFKGGKFRERVEKFHVIDHVKYSTPRGRDDGETIVEVTFNDRILENMVDEDSRWFRLMGLGTYFELDLPTSKRLFRYLDSKRYRGTVALMRLALTLKDLKDHLPVLTDAPTHIKRTLDTAHVELVEAEILAEMPTIEKSAAGRGAENWLVTYVFAETGTYAESVRSGGVSTPKPLALKPPVREEDWPDYLGRAVQSIAEVLGAGATNRGWYAKIAKALPADRLRALLSDMRDAKRSGGWTPDTLRAIFGKRAIAAADDLGIDLSREAAGGPARRDRPS